MDTDEFDYVNVIYDAGRTAGVSPYFLAARIIQEMGFSGRSALCKGTVEGYEGYYNFYNIGSVSTTKEGGATVGGAKYAKFGRNPEKDFTDAETKILLPWDTKEKAIKGGALWIASGYIEKGQNTLYFQKFDVLDDGTVRCNHQYAQNIMMAYSEALRYYNSYDSINKTESSFVFVIPVYKNMPAEYGYLP
jgi:beta-N-acetylglucosaminidase